MKKLLLSLVMLFHGTALLFAETMQEDSCEVCIYGASSAGVIAARAVALQGKSLCLIEPGFRIGGLSSGGLGQTDIGNKQVVEGLSKEFYRRVGRHYGRLESWIFEPKVALSAFERMLREVGAEPWCGYRLAEVRKEGRRLTGIVVENPRTGIRRHIRARIFIDCSYEGDLMAEAGVSYFVGRESNATYGETWNGVQLLQGHQFPDGIDPYIVPGDPASGLVWGVTADSLQPRGSGDNRLQAYNYRICLTDDPANRLPIARPVDYDSTRYELLARLIAARPERQSLHDYFIWSPMPNRKTDVNNLGGFSTDAIGLNAGYAEASYEERERIARAHTSYTLGLLYFMAHDSRVPEALRNRMSVWGLPLDEYPENGHWTPQLYVREARRLKGEYVVTQHDCEGRTRVDDPVGMAAYTMDSHNCQRIVVVKQGRAMVKNEGNVEVGGFPPYPISYRALIPQREECTNLLVPVCLSASHIAYGSIRMEPVFMVLGQAAAIAAGLALDRDADVQEISGKEIRAIFAADPRMDGSVPDLILDDAALEIPAGSPWQRVPWGYGPGSLALDRKAEAEPLRYEFTVARSGDYAVYAYYHRNEDAAQRMTFEVNDGEHTDRIEVQSDTIRIAGQTRGEWIPLGVRRFDAQRKAFVAFCPEDRSGHTYADAIQLVAVEKNRKR